jgi:hypothetical protein
VTSDLPDAQTIGDRLYAVPPQSDTRIPGTRFVVWHDEDAASTVSVLSDGAIELGRGDGWIVRTML